MYSHSKSYILSFSFPFTMVVFFCARIQEGLLYIDPYDPVVQNELNSGKFSVLARRDSRTGAAIALFTASLHCPLTASHQSVLKVFCFCVIDTT